MLTAKQERRAAQKQTCKLLKKQGVAPEVWVAAKCPS